MPNIANQLILKLATLSAILTYFSFKTTSVLAFTLNGNTVQDITAADIGKSFTVSFGGQINGINQEGLSSQSIFKISGFQTVNKVIDGVTKQVNQVTLDIILGNTSSSNILSSRTSALGFNVSNPLLGATIQEIEANTKPLFANASLNSKLFNGSDANVNLCFSDNNNCRGGKSGGVTNGNSGSFSTSFYVDSSVKKISLSNFGVRYQSIDFANTKTKEDESGTGYSVEVAPKGSYTWIGSQDSHLW
ncbi:MAG TPA: hypothetical protein DDZ80_18355 [Cyanobacteria bacterium UBA8803]|nr:hypothetical protein [Cyanobacteria bacterium UBA9273]HBL60345.1 hypothetical protein [Cyanobacteria bacterium UBA8803]